MSVYDYEKSRELYEEGRRVLESGNCADAIPLLRSSAEAAPHFKSLELLGEAYMNVGHLSLAIIYFAAASSLNTQVRAKSLLSKALYEFGDYYLAKSKAEEVLDQSSGNRIAKEVYDDAIKKIAESE